MCSNNLLSFISISFDLSSISSSEINSGLIFMNFFEYSTGKREISFPILIFFFFFKIRIIKTTTPSITKLPIISYFIYRIHTPFFENNIS